jgi:ribosomal protein L11 methyltransferase
MAERAADGDVMIHLARIELDETAARALADAVGEDADLDGPTVAASALPTGLWSVEVYFADRPAKTEAAALARLAGKERAFTVTKLPDVNWVRKSLEGLKPVRAGRFLVHGAHDRGERRPNDIAIEIEAGEAFGTGHHGTTSGCLLEIDRLARVRHFRRPLDIGTGSGVLAIACAKLRHGTVVATDIDPVAVRVARVNAITNGAGGFVHPVVASTLAHRTVRAGGPYDLVVANILAGPLQALARAIGAATAPGGIVILSGLLPEQRARIVSAYRWSGLTLRRASTHDGWLTLTFKRGR